MSKPTIIILSEARTTSSPYTSYVHSHAKELIKQGFNVVVLASVIIKPNNKVKYKGEKIIDGVRVIYFNCLSVSMLFYKSRININAILYYLCCKKIIKKIIKQENVVLIDAHTFKIHGTVASYIKKKYNIFTTVTLHGTSFNNNLKFKNGINQIKKVANIVDYMICVSEKIEKQLKKLNINNTKVIYNGIELKEETNKKKEQYSMITVGALTPIKNIDVVIKSFNKVIKEFPNTTLTIVGAGEMMESLKELAKPNMNNIKFTGFISNEEVQQKLSTSNVFLLPSSPEGFGICYVEAMYNKCITIGTKNEGIDGFIKDKENGFLINIDENEIANLIIDIFNNKFNLDEIRKKAYNDASNLTWDKNAKEYIKLLGVKK